MRLERKVAIITGGGGGIGRSASALFAREGAKVLIADVNQSAAERVAGEISRDGGDVEPYEVNVAVASEVEEMVAFAERRFGRLNVLFNNAGIFDDADVSVLDTSEEVWDRVMAVNVKGIWNAVKAVLPVMKAQRAGRIVNVASAIAPKGTPYLLHYVTSKGAVITMTRALARELGEFGIGINALAPGLTFSDSVLRNPAISGFQADAVRQSRAFKRDEVPEDLEGAVVFLASADSAFITGQTLVVDGGSIFL